MVLALEDKKAIVADVNATASQALSLVVADSRGIPVANLTALRKQAREAKVHMRVVRNTLARRAVAGTEFECAQDVFKGPSLLAFSMEDPAAAARLFKAFAKANDKFQVRALVFGGKLMGGDKIDVLATMPTREQALGMFARVLLEVPTQFARALAAVRDQREPPQQAA
jgi:large subunit ribosomal protein L10